jgi:Concanavalin A-like lectin/glucanases superfamily
MTFSYTSGNPANLVGGAPASMNDIQGPFNDIAAYLNALPAPGPAGGFNTVLTAQPVLDVGMLAQIRAGRQLTPADFTAMGLSAPLGLWNLSSLVDSSGNNRTLVNKGSVPFGVGINGQATTAAVFAGSTAQALYIADTGASDPFRIKTGSWGCWLRTAKRGVNQNPMAKNSGAAGGYGWQAIVNAANNFAVWASTDGTTASTAVGTSDVCDDRWHFCVCTADGAFLRAYVDGALEGVGVCGPLNPVNGPLNIGGVNADGSNAAVQPHYGRIDEAFVTGDVLTDEQIRVLYCAKIAHALGSAPNGARLSVRRARRGGALATSDFPTAPLRLHNFTAGALTDQGSNGVALTNPNAAVGTGGADGTPNGAYNFNGSQSLSSTDAGLPSGTNARSYGTWFKTTSLPLHQAVMAWGGVAGSTDTRTYITGGAGTITSTNGADSMTGSFVVDGLWHHLVVVEDNAAADGVRRKLYIDGRLVAGSTVLNSITLTGANRFRVGANADASVPFIGQLDGAFVCGYALTSDQIAALYAKATEVLGPSPKEAGAHVEAFDTNSVYVLFDALDTTAQVDLGVAA